jgi:hypothetical protein
MIWVWVAIVCIPVSLAMVFALALCKISALAAEEALRALEDESWAVAPPTRTVSEEQILEQPQEAPLRSKR